MNLLLRRSKAPPKCANCGYPAFMWLYGRALCMEDARRVANDILAHIEGDGRHSIGGEVVRTDEAGNPLHLFDDDDNEDDA